MANVSQIKKRIKQKSSLLGAAIFGKSFDLIRGAIFLKIFSPSDFGLIDIVNQLISLSKYADIGLLDNTKREYNYDVIKQPIIAEQRKSASYGYDLIITFILFITLLSSSFFIIESYVVKVGVIFGSFSFLLTKLIKILKLDMTLTKNFKAYTKLSITLTLVQNILILSTVSFIGIYAPLVIKSIALLIVFLYTLNKYPLKLKFKIEWHELNHQIKYGIVFSGISILFGIWIFFERFIITKYFSLTEVGIYAACIFILKLGAALLDEFIKPTAINVKESLSNFNIEIIKKYVLFPTCIFFLISYPIAIISQQLVHLLEFNFLKNYLGIGNYFYFLSFLIPVYGIGSISGYLLFSKGVDRFAHIYVLYLIKFSLLGTLCFLYPPILFETLLVYLVTVELLFFYCQQFLIFSKFFNKLLTLFITSILFGAQVILLYY